MKVIFLALLLLIVQRVLAQLPIITPDGVHQRFITEFYQGGNIVIAKNSTGLNILNCSSVISYGDYCSILGVVNPENIIYSTATGFYNISAAAARNFGNVIATDGSGSILISYGIGQLIFGYMIIADFVPAFIEPVINTGGLSDPSSLTNDYSINLFYAAYSNINYQGAGVIVLRDITQKKYEYITNFNGDILKYEDGDYLNNGVRNLQIAALVGYLLIGMPDANNGQGVVLIYDCFVEPCVYQGQVENPEPMRRFNFGSSVAVSFDGFESFYLTVGVQNYKTDDYNGYLTNFNSGSAITYYCSLINDTSPNYRGFVMNCPLGLSYQYEMDDFIEDTCYSENLNFGQSVQMASDSFAGVGYTFVSAPSTCNGNGAVWLYEINFTDITAPQRKEVYKVSEFYEGDGLGYNLYYSTIYTGLTSPSYAYANSNEGGYLMPVPAVPLMNSAMTRAQFLAKKPTKYRHRAIWTKMKNAGKIPGPRMNIK